MSDPDFELHLTDEEYNELARLWHEYITLGLPDREHFEPLDFCEWIDEGEDEPHFSLPQIEAFLAEKERREGTAVPKTERTPIMTTLTTNKLALIDLDGAVIDATARFARAEEIRLTHLSEAGDRTANERYWREALDPAYTHLDTLIEGADEHLASLRREGFRILYISSRPESMRDATLKWLYDHGIFDDLNLLVLKAASFQFQKTVIWYDWMADTLVHTFQAGQVVLVSNKQANIDAMRRPIAGLQPRAYHRLADIFDPAHGADDIDDPFFPS